MATSAWLRGPSAMRLTEGLVSVLKEQRPEYLPALLANYREHGVFQTQVEERVSSVASYLLAAYATPSRATRLCFLFAELTSGENAAAVRC